SLGIDGTEAAIGLAASPHPHAYQPALDALLASRADDPRAARAVLDFLEADSERLYALRLRAAAWLRERGMWDGLPRLLGEALRRGKQQEEWENLLRGAPADAVAAAVDVV